MTPVTPNHRHAMVNLGNVLKELGKMREAAERFFPSPSFSVFR